MHNTQKWRYNTKKISLKYSNYHCSSNISGDVCTYDVRCPNDVCRVNDVKLDNYIRHNNEVYLHTFRSSTVEASTTQWSMHGVEDF